MLPLIRPTQAPASWVASPRLPSSGLFALTPHSRPPMCGTPPHLQTGLGALFEATHPGGALLAPFGLHPTPHSGLLPQMSTLNILFQIPSFPALCSSTTSSDTSVTLIGCDILCWTSPRVDIFLKPSPPILPCGCLPCSASHNSFRTELFSRG